jgi:signal transduction histidine kinase
VERAREKLPAELTATVSFVEGAGGTVFVQDATAGTHLHFKPARSDLRVGDQLKVRGVTMAGLYLPGIEVETAEVLGHAEPPAAVLATYDDLATGRYHYQRVKVEGIGRTMSLLDENRTLLRLAMGSRVIEVRVDAPLEGAATLIDARLALKALAAGGINDRRQLVFPYLRVSDWSDVRVTTAPPAPETLPILPAAGLLHFGVGDGPQGRVRIAGTVLATFDDGRVFLRDSSPLPREIEALDKPPQAPSIQVSLHGGSPVNVGDAVEVLGFPVMQGFSATLADATLLRAEAGALPAAEVVSLAALMNGSHDADLVTLNAPVLVADVHRARVGFEIRCSLAESTLTALWLGAEPPQVEIGASYRLTGICLVESSMDKGFRSLPTRASILLRGAEDVELLGSAPFWTSRHLWMAVGVLVSAVLLTLAWVHLQRRQIRGLERRIIDQATAEERQRIAREFHDTLEQDLAGLRLRLDAATTRPLDEKASALLEASRNLVSRIQAEARNLVADLRENVDATSLADSLRQLGEEVREHFQWVTLDVEDLPGLSLPVAHHLRMIAHEAVTNVLKHAAATELKLYLAASDHQLTLCITDNGRGFATENETQGKAGHFGCIGIRERCRKIDATVLWESQPGRGSSVTVTLPK